MAMFRNENGSLNRRIRLLAAAATIAVAAGAGFGLVTAGTGPVRAEAVRIEAPAAAPGFADVVEKVSPAVVSVRVTSKIAPASDRAEQFGFPGMEDLPRDHPLNRFFREFRGERGERGGREFRNERRSQRARPVSQGSGFFISEDGYLVTNNHVISGGSEFQVVMDDGTELAATLVGSDQRTDLAVLKVEEARKFTYVTFADDLQTRVGDWVVAVGNPFGLGGTVTAGIVSARGRDIGAGPYDDFLQIDAAVNRGNSGGPAFNLRGEVVGVNTAIFSPSGGNVGIAFAIPASVTKDVVAALMSDGEIERGWLGVQIQPVNKDIAESLGLDGERGALIAEAQADGPALAAGIRSGDVITAIDDTAIASPRELARTIARKDPGATVKVELWRDGASQTVDVKLGELPGEERQAALPETETEDGSTVLDDFGLTVAPAEEGDGVVVTDVASDSSAAERGLQAGDVIRMVNGNSVKSAGEVETQVEAAASAGRKAVLFQVEREDASRFVALPVTRG